MPSKIIDMQQEDQEEEEGEERRSSSRTPRGHFVVYVGTKKLERFVVPTRFLKSPSFQKLLDKSAEEFGYAENHQNKIVLPCDVSTFRSLVMFLSSLDK